MTIQIQEDQRSCNTHLRLKPELIIISKHFAGLQNGLSEKNEGHLIFTILAV